MLHANSGCSGGLIDSAFTFYKNAAIAAESSYLYIARYGTCETSFASFTTAIPSGGVTGYKVVAVASGLTCALNHQPVSMSIEADQAVFLNYEIGTITSGCGTNLDHGVLAVGYDNTASYYLAKLLLSAHVVFMSLGLSSAH